MGAVAHGECQVCGSRAPIDMAARIAELEAALVSINDAAVTYRDQIGTGPLLANVRTGFQLIVEISREAASRNRDLPALGEK